MCEDGGDVEVETGGGEGDPPTVDEDLGASREGSRTDEEAVERSDHTKPLQLKFTIFGYSVDFYNSISLLF